MSNQIRKILLLAANPQGSSRLLLDKEMREIKEGWKRSRYRDKYLIVTAEAVRYRDIHRAILEHEPQIIHFCGHGSGEDGLVFEDESGQIKLVDAEALAGLFQLFADQVKCVVLNACYSKYQAVEIAHYIDYVVGMNQEIDDEAAIEFAVGFYDALCADKGYEFAYKLGCNSIRIAGIAENLGPQLMMKTQLQQTPGLKETDIIVTEDTVVAHLEDIKLLIQQPIPAQPSNTTLLQIINRRQFLQWASLGGAGLVTAVVTSEIYIHPSPKSIPLPSPKSTPLLSSKSTPMSSPDSTALQSFQFEVVTVDLQGKITNRRPAQAKSFAEDLGNGVTLEMVEIPTGYCQMGSPSEEKNRDANEEPQHTVNVPTFFMGKFEVTQEQYQQVMGSNPSYYRGIKRPIERVSWNNAMEFCKKLSQKTGREYRLPSEAEWEYACRAGTTTPFHFGETITTKLANYVGTHTYASEPQGTYGQQTKDVGSFPANAFGLYDMHGNVSEWCADSWHENYQGAPIDGSIWETNDNRYRVLRGGSCDDSPVLCRSANRFYVEPDLGNVNIGFRVMCDVRDFQRIN